MYKETDILQKFVVCWIEIFKRNILKKRKRLPGGQQVALQLGCPISRNCYLVASYEFSNQITFNNIDLPMHCNEVLN